MQTGEVLRREVFNLLDAAKGGRLKKLKEVNKREIVEGWQEFAMQIRKPDTYDFTGLLTRYPEKNIS